jgi:outer membrane protein TolC
MEKLSAKKARTNMKNPTIVVIILFHLVTKLLVAQPLSGLLTLALENNPELQGWEKQYQAALQKAPQVSQLPDIQLGVAAPVYRPNTRLGAQSLTLGATQMLPWFGVLDAKKAVTLSMAEIKYENIEATRLELFFKIKSAYYQLYFLSEKQKILQNSIHIFESLEQVALGRLESGRAIASDVLRLQLKRQELMNQIELIEKEKETFSAQINEVMNRSPEIPVLAEAPADSIAIMEMNLSMYQELIRVNHPLILQLDQQMMVSQLEQNLNQLLQKPTIGFGLDYSLVTAYKDISPENNGRDILIPRAMITLPISREKFRAKDQEEILMRESFLLQKTTLENKLFSLLQSYKTEYESALINIQLAGQQKSTIQSAYNILLAEYSSRGNRFDELLQLQNQLISYDLMHLQARTQTHLVKAKIERLTDFQD